MHSCTGSCWDCAAVDSGVCRVGPDMAPTGQMQVSDLHAHVRAAGGLSGVWDSPGDTALDATGSHFTKMFEALAIEVLLWCNVKSASMLFGITCAQSSMVMEGTVCRGR